MIDQKLYDNLLELLETTEKNNPDLINYFTSHKDDWQGPVLVEKNRIQRTLGPEQEMLNSESQDAFKSKVANILESIKQNPDKEVYLLCEKFNDTYYLLDGNHSLEALKKIGHTQFSIIYTNDSIIYKLLNSNK